MVRRCCNSRARTATLPAVPEPKVQGFGVYFEVDLVGGDS
jgi:hypothetical protein